MKNHYGALGIGRNATGDEIKSAYRQMSRRHHPDLTGSDGREFLRVREAFAVLGDPAQKATYDLEWDAWLRSSGLTACLGCGWANHVKRLRRGETALCCNCEVPLPRPRVVPVPSDGGFGSAISNLVGQLEREAPDLAGDLVRLGITSLRSRFGIKHRKGRE